jgi:hypothetical protein
MIKIKKNENKRDVMLAIVYNMMDKHNKNYSEDLLGEFKTHDNIRQSYNERMNGEKIIIKHERLKEIFQYTEDEIRAYIDKQKELTRGYKNNFTHIIELNQDIFDKFLEDDRGYKLFKSNCKDLLKESIQVYKTKYSDELYIKTDAIHYKYIGNSYEDIYQYYKSMYKDTQENLQRYIPFGSFFKQRMINERTFESLEPNRHILLFDDCILDVSTGTHRPCDKITDDIIPFTVIQGEYKTKEDRCHEFVVNLLNKLVDEPNVLKSILYSLINKDELIKSAIFNIQKSGKGKTKLLEPLKDIGLLQTIDSDTLGKTLEREAIFTQKLIANFEEIQETNIHGSQFNSLIDDSEIKVPRKYQKAIVIPSYIKPTIIINGEDLPDFKGRTRGTLNRFSLMPKFTGEITSDDAEFIKANGFQIGIEMLRYLMIFKMSTEKRQRMEWLESCKITEQTYLELRESKIKTIFQYIKDTPSAGVKGTDSCISEKILEDMIIYLQEENVLTVNLFNKESSIKKFIKKEIIPLIDISDGEWDGYLNQSSRQAVHKGDDRKTHVLKYCLQLTDDGKTLVEDIGYKVNDLKIKDEK